MEGHVVPVKTYVTVYIALVVLLALTYGVAHLDLGAFNIVAAMVIALIKMVLVILFFMGVKYSTRLVWVWATVGFLWLALMFTILTDYYSRGWISIGRF